MRVPGAFESTEDNKHYTLAASHSFQASRLATLVTDLTTSSGDQRSGSGIITKRISPFFLIGHFELLSEQRVMLFSETH